MPNITEQNPLDLLGHLTHLLDVSQATLICLD